MTKVFETDYLQAPPLKEICKRNVTGGSINRNFHGFSQSVAYSDVTSERTSQLYKHPQKIQQMFINVTAQYHILVFFLCNKES
jgi:hypothetical protein